MRPQEAPKRKGLKTASKRPPTGLPRGSNQHFAAAAAVVVAVVATAVVVLLLLFLLLRLYFLLLLPPLLPVPLLLLGPKIAESRVLFSEFAEYA